MLSGSREMHPAWAELPGRCAGAPRGTVWRVGVCQGAACCPSVEGRMGPGAASCRKLPGSFILLY